MSRKAELFRHDVPVLRTSLFRHGLVDPSTSPEARRASLGPPSSEDLTATDRGEEQWATTAAAVGGSGAGFQALVGVDSVVVGHVRAAEELRSTLLSLSSSKEPLKARARAASTAARRGEQSSPDGEERVLRKRHGSLETFPPPPPSAPSSRRQRAGPAASMAAASAMAAARRVDRPFYAGASGRTLTSRLSGGNPEETPQPTGGVSMANLLDIAVTLFGPSGRGGGGRHSAGGGIGSAGTPSSSSSSSSSSRVKQSKHKDEKLVTFTVDVHAGNSTTLGVTVKELGGGAVFVEDVRKLPGGFSGPAELAGILIGDVILGINYKPLEKGLVHTSTLLAEAIALSGFVKLQISRAVRSNTWRQPLPGNDCAIVTELMWRTAQLRKFGVLSSAERHTIAGLILQRMAWEEGALVRPPRAPAPLSLLTPGVVAASSLESAASAVLDSMVLQVKGLREAISVRCLCAKSTIETVEVSPMWGPPTADEAMPGSTATATATPEAAATPASTLVTVRYILRVEDIGTGREWLVFPQYSDFSELHQELLMLWPPVADLPFPAKRPVPRATALGSMAAPGPGGGDAVVEERGARLEAFLDGVIALLGIYASIDSRCSEAMRLVQAFLRRPKDLVSAELALSPALCDQKRAELLVYKLLNQFDSPAARLKHSLTRDFEREVCLAPNVESLMKGASSRLRRLQDFVLEEHEEQLSSSAYDTSEAKEATMRKAVRRQVELSLYLPLRGCLWKELTRRLQRPARKLSRAIKVLRDSSPVAFGVETPGILASKEWGPVKESMGQATRRVLPTDQIDGLRRAAEHITALHASLQQSARGGGGNYAADERSDSNSKPNSGAVGVVDDDDIDRSWKLYNQRREEEEEEEDGKLYNQRGGNDEEGSEEEEEEEEGAVVYIEDTTTARHGCFNPENGHLGSRERDRGGRLTVSGDNSTACPPKNHTRETYVDGGGSNGGGGGRATDSVVATDSTAVRPLAQRDLETDSTNTTANRVAEPETKEAVPVPLVDKHAWGAELTHTNTGSVVVTTEFPAMSGEAPLRGGKLKGRLRSWCASSASDETRPTLQMEPTSSCESINSLDNNHGAGANSERRERDRGEGSAGGDGRIAAAGRRDSDEAMGADDFLPLFALVLVHSAPLDLLLPQTLLTHLMDLDGSLSEAGYLVATLEAAVAFITQVYSSRCCADGQQDSPP